MVNKKFESRIAKALPQLFGIVLNGWTEAGVHYCGVFAVYLNKAPGCAHGWNAQTVQFALMNAKKKKQKQTR